MPWRRFSASPAQTPSLALRDTLHRQLLPLALLVVVLVTLSAPMAFFWLRLKGLEQQGVHLAGQIAALIQREVQLRPLLWKYDTLKILRHVRQQRQQSRVHRIEIVDEHGYPLELSKKELIHNPSTASGRQSWSVRDSFDSGSPSRMVWGTRSIFLERRRVGAVWVALDTDPIRIRSLELFLLLLAIGGVLGGFLYILPLRTMERAESQIRTLVHGLDEARQALAVANQNLEQQVAERSSQLAQAYHELQTKEQHLRLLSARTMSIQDAERRQIARELHDSAGQALTAIRIQLQLLAHLLPPDTPNSSSHAKDSDTSETMEARSLEHAKRGEEVNQENPVNESQDPRHALLGEIVEMTDQTLQEIRRAVMMLGPSVLDDFGLRVALVRACEDFRDRTQLEVECEVGELSSMPTAIESACYRIVQEALTNIARHAEAQSVWVCVTSQAQTPTEQSLHIDIHDDGVGFSVELLETSHNRGLRGMQERIELLAGTFEIASHPDTGTQLRISIPYTSPSLAEESV